MCPDKRVQIEEMIIQALQEAKRHPVSFRKLSKSIARIAESYNDGLAISILDRLANDRAVITFGHGTRTEYYWAGNLAHMKERICTIIGLHHKNFPYEPGIGIGEIKKRFSESHTMNARRNVDPRLFDLAISICKEDGLIVETDRGVRLSGFIIQSGEIDRLETEILAYISQRPHTRTDIEELSCKLDADARKIKVIISGMINTHKLVRIDNDRYLEPSVIEHLQDILIPEFGRKSPLTATEIKTFLDLPRSAAIPLLEHFDKIGFTSRNGDYRKLAHKPNIAPAQSQPVKS